MAAAKKKPAKKPAKKKKKLKVNPGGPDKPVTTSTATPASSTPASSVVASEDMSSAPADGTSSGATNQTGTQADTADSIFSSGPGYTPHYHQSVPAAEQYAAESASQTTSEVSPI
jgi:hypothetical protein